MSETPKSAGPVAPELLADLAAASRILAARGVVDGFGHVSMRHPGFARPVFDVKINCAGTGGS